MNDIVSPVQSISYTNKDFISVYTELLDLTKELTSQWDPSISNESDPGVILLKLNAVIADKCNYAIDKSILECFPLSVTQETNARQLFEQLGYYMHWYKAASTDVFVKWIGDTNNNSFNIPKFTMVTDSTENIIYTLLGPSMSTLTGAYNISDQTLYCDGREGITFTALQGIAVNYEINGSTLITVDNLDLNNRLYFPTIDIAENGIFIRNASEENYVSWVKKDNLLIENLGNTFYKFGVTRDGSSCYIEFPEDAEAIFKDGIYITYIRTNGRLGNVSAQYLSKFYNFNSVYIDNVIVNLDESNILISNYSAAVNGLSTEDINSAYKGYKRTVGTFDTLVTLRDYINYINNSGLVSNGFVCDRNNDIQCTYKVMTSINDVDQTVTMIEDNSDINAYTLKLYLLTYVDNINLSTYAISFYLEDNNEQATVKNYLYDSQTINHEFAELLDPTATSAHICLFKNKCPIECTIITQSTLTATQLSEMRLNIVDALYQEFNAKELNFGDKFPYDLVYTTILNADSRIKNVSLGNLEYTTYAVYQDSSRKLTYTNVNGTNKWLNNEWEEEYPSDYGLNPHNPIVGAQVSLPTVYKEVNISDDSDKVYFCSSNKELTAEVDLATYLGKLGNEHCFEELLFICTDDDPSVVWELEDGTTADLSEYGIIINGTVQTDDQFKVRLSYAYQFRTDVYVKSVLAGITQFYQKDETFDYKLNNRYKSQVDNVEKLWSNVDITLSYDDSNNSDNTEYTLKQNESLQFFYPNLITKASYSNNVKFEYRLFGNINKNINYQLGTDEYIIFYWKESEDTVYQYASYGYGTIVSSSFGISASTAANIADNPSYNLLNRIAVDEGNYSYSDKSSARFGDMSSECNNAVSQLKSADHILSSSKSISIKIVNQFTIDINSNYGLYWILNTSKNGKYVLFEEGQTTRTLNNDEMFIYTNPAFTSYTVLGAGTTLTRNTISDIWQVDVVDSSTITTEGLSALQNVYFTIPIAAELLVTENVFITLSNHTKIEVSVSENSNNIDTYNCEVTVGSFTITDFDANAWNYGSAVLSYDGTSWKLTGTSTVVDLEEAGITISGIPSSGNKITVTQYTAYSLQFSNEGCSIIIPSTASDYHKGNSPTLADFDFKYATIDDYDTWIPLEKITLVDQNGFSARSLLGIKISPTLNQTLLENQSINYKIVGDSTTYSINGAVPTSEIVVGDVVTEPATYPECVLASFTISSDGSIVVDSYLSSYNSDGELIKTYLSLYEFATVLNSPQVESLTVPDQITFDSDGAINFIFEPDVNERSLDIALPIGEYIIAVKNYESNLTDLYIMLDNVKLTVMHDKVSYDLKNPGDYYLYMSINSTSEKTLTVHVEGHTMRCAIKLSNCYKYLLPDNFSSTEKEFIETEISRLDENSIFKYNYEVPDSILIEDPLVPAEFFNINHIYNSFTIGQLDTIKIR